MTTQNTPRSDHAHGNRPYLHSHTGENGHGFGHTLAEHEVAGDLGSRAIYTTETVGIVYVGDVQTNCAICNSICKGHIA